MFGCLIRSALGRFLTVVAAIYGSFVPLISEVAPLSLKFSQYQLMLLWYKSQVIFAWVMNV